MALPYGFYFMPDHSRSPPSCSPWVGLFWFGLGLNLKFSCFPFWFEANGCRAGFCDRTEADRVNNGGEDS